MTSPRGRARRPDDWPSSHVRARADVSHRLDGALEPREAEWLDAHLAACPECTNASTAYSAQRAELRGLRDRAPQAPRDLWARTAAAIESDATFRERGRRSQASRRSALAPVALLSAAIAVAVIVGTLTSSRGSLGDGTASPSRQVAIATGSGAARATAPGATPLAVAQRVEWLRQDADGAYRLQVANVDHVCPADAVAPCDTAAPVENRD
ncbi:MAG: hypothetical protein QOF49_1946, partial [Chloroflexota bacterium]|nr:hypothetical protein [Chloroflexota bacterium]